MHRRDFLTTSLAASALALTGQAEAQVGNASSNKAREYYEIRRYRLVSGPQTKLVDSYMEEALIPALNRMGIAPVGAFKLEFGPETPMLYVLMPSTNLETLVTADLRLVQDAEFMKVAAPFWDAPATAPPFQRIESSLHVAFEGWPKLTVPPMTAKKEKRIFQLRTYESPSNRDHVRKVEMFNSGEYDIFRASGAKQVFYGDTLVGARLPNLTYMLSFTDMAELNADWDAFRNAPAWKKLSGSERYAFESIVGNVSNLVLNPAPYSQI